MRVVRFLLGVLIVGMMPMTARAQVAGAITGVVRDTQGGIVRMPLTRCRAGFMALPMCT
jgi:hypothetical protein